MVTWLRVDISDVVAEEDLTGGARAEKGGVVGRPEFKLLVSPITKRPSEAETMHLNFYSKTHWHTDTHSNNSWKWGIFT